MRLGTMTAIVVLLASVTSGSEGSGLSDLEDVRLPSRTAIVERPHRHRHRPTRLRRNDEESAARRPASDSMELLRLRSAEAEQLELEDGRRRYTDPAADFSVCCPSVEERIKPRAGKRRDGSLGVLYADEDIQQVFFERSCARDEDHGRMRRLLRRRYHCEQEYSYSYAVYNVSGSKVLDYIRIRSGCRCEVKHRSSRRKKKRREERRKRAEKRRREKRRRRAQRGAESQTNARNAS